jgi:hypothetical protein
VIKGDARPGGYILVGGHGGILAGVGHDTKPSTTVAFYEIGSGPQPHRTDGVVARRTTPG